MGSLETFSLYSEIKWHDQITLTEVFWTEFEGGKKKKKQVSSRSTMLQ